MLNLDRRKCFLGIRSKTDSKHHDGTESKVMTLELEEIPLTKRELNALMMEPHAWDSLFHDVNGKVEPFLRSLKRLELCEPVKQAYVELVYGLHRREVKLSECKLTKVKLELRGGEAIMSCKLVADAVLDEFYGELIEHLGDPIEVEMRFEPPGQQQDLPLNTFQGDNPPPAKPPKRGRPPKAQPSDGAAPTDTPEQAREKAHKREQRLAQQIADDRGRPN
jgi:hypothetical protein